MTPWIRFFVKIDLQAQYFIPPYSSHYCSNIIPGDLEYSKYILWSCTKHLIHITCYFIIFQTNVNQSIKNALVKKKKIRSKIISNQMYNIYVICYLHQGILNNKLAVMQLPKEKKNNKYKISNFHLIL